MKQSEEVTSTKAKMQINQQKQKEILKVANELFLKYGYKRTSLQMIVRQTGGSLATIYKIFGNKENLFQEVIKSDSEIFIETLNKIFIQNIDSNLNLEKYFYNFGQCLIREMLSAKNIAFMRLMILEGYNNPKFVKVFSQCGDEISHFVIRGIEYYNKKQNLEIGEKEIEGCAKLFIHLIIEPYWLHPLIDSDYQPPPNAVIEHTLMRAIKFFMLYLKTYKEIL